MQFAETVARVVRAGFAEENSLTPRTFFSVTRNPRTLAAIDPPLIRHRELKGEPHTYAKQMRAIASCVQATTVAQAYEVWMCGELREQAGRGYESGLETNPSAKEMLVLFCEERGEAPRAWTAPITRRRFNAPLLQPFREAALERVEGWLSAILEPQR